MPEQSPPATDATASAEGSARAVRGVFLDHEHLGHTTPRSMDAGSRLFDVSVVPQRHGDERPTPVTAQDPRADDFTSADDRSARTPGTGRAGAVAALAPAGVTVPTGGAHALDTKAGLDGVPDTSREAPEAAIVSVRADAPGEEERALAALRAAGAARVRGRTRPC